MASTPVKTVIFDIGDVVCGWAPPTTLTVNPKLFKEFRDSPTWYDYDCDKIGEDECFSRLAAQGGVGVADIAAAFEMVRNSLVPHNSVVAAIRELKTVHPGLRVYAMSNISRADWQIVRNKPFGWNIFDHVFTSCETGMRKPELRFYHHVLEETGTAPGEAVFVDDKADNVVAARSLGFREAIVFDDVANVRRKLLNVLGDPAWRGREWMSKQAKGIYSETDRGDAHFDNFAQLLIYEVTEDRSLLSSRYFDRTWNYQAEAPIGTSFPDDVDTTSYAFKVLPLDSTMAHSILDEMISAEQTTADGIVKVYFDKSRSRTDPTACINVVRMYYKFGRGDEPGLQPTKSWIQDVLLFRGYINGTRYYHQPEVFLYFFARLLLENPMSDMFQKTAALLRERLVERINSEADSLALAMRILACHYMGVRDELDLKRLLTMQQEDGSFGVGWLCQYGTSQIKVGNRALTTALAVAAVEASMGSGGPTTQKTQLVSGGDVEAPQQNSSPALAQHDHTLEVRAPA